MMKIAVISDIHGNYQATFVEAVFEASKKARKDFDIQ